MASGFARLASRATLSAETNSRPCKTKAHAARCQPTDHSFRRLV